LICLDLSRAMAISIVSNRSRVVVSGLSALRLAPTPARREPHD
jgi:hypothetical protein